MASTIDSVYQIAKNHLGMLPTAPDSDIPRGYVAELQNHLAIYPHDTNFKITAAPRRGYGLITCLEDGCKRQSFRLEPKEGFDDGKLEGIGSLKAYRNHIVQHSTHGIFRHQRVKAMASAKRLQLQASATTKTHPSNSSNTDGAMLPVHPAHTTRTASNAGHNSTQSGLARLRSMVSVKSELTDPVIPQKRVNNMSIARVSSPKKIKMEIAQSPLADIDHNASSTFDVDVIRQQIASIQTTISNTETLLNRCQAKRHPTKSDLTRMTRYQNEINLLRRRKASWSSKLPYQHIPILDLKAEPNPSSRITLGATAGTVPILSLPKQEPHTLHISTAKQALHPGDIPNVAKAAQQTDSGAGGVHAVLQRLAPALPSIPAIAGSENYDEDGDFYGRGKDTFAGPRARADDFDTFVKNAGNCELFQSNATVEEALKKLGLKSISDTIADMEVALMPHQAIGVAWMYDREVGPGRFMGGCLADDMGLGKTVQMIALVLKNRPNKGVKTTLVIAPTALLDQWRSEIELKTNEVLKCLIYHGTSKPRTAKELLKYDVVLTTFQTMACEWPDFETEQKKKVKRQKANDSFLVSDSDDDTDDCKPSKRKQKLGLLFQVEFYRVVLDEAQVIRNRRTRVSRAVTDLKSTYRWCLTGTPIVNGVADVYPLLRFLEVRPWYDWKEYNSHIAKHEKKRAELAVVRLQSILNICVLRRKKDSMLDGKPLVELPIRTVSLMKLEFTPEEREVYTSVESRTQATFNRYLRAGTVLKNYTQVLVLLLRLRQVCAHPSLIQEDASAFVAPDEHSDADLARDLARARHLMGDEWVDNMKAKFKESALQRIEAEKESAEATLEDEECAICFDIFTNALITSCGHAFCKECINGVLCTPAPDQADDLKAHERPCPSCRSAICRDSLFSRAAFEPTDDDLYGNDSDVKMLESSKVEDNDDDNMSDFIVDDDEDEDEDYGRRIRGSKRKPFLIVDSDDEMDTFEEKEVLFGKKPKADPKGKTRLMSRFLPSTKMKWMMERIQALAEEHPDEKTIVISQWTGCLTLVSDYLTEHGILHVKYQGDMSRPKRDNAVRVFMAKDKARVMLMSMKCGGVGLNLTRANNVISLDLGWSQAVEAQAFDRAHRLGQTRAVDIRRLVISNTVEDRILAMQERKQNIADGSMGEGAGKKIGRLSVKELANLFGLDHRGAVLQIQN